MQSQPQGVGPLLHSSVVGGVGHLLHISFLFNSEAKTVQLIFLRGVKRYF